MSLFHIFLTRLFYYSVLFTEQLSKFCLPANNFSDFFFAFFCRLFSMKEELRAGKNHRCFEEIINYCNEYEKDIEKVDHQNQDMFHQHYQFGAISFYSHTTSTATPGKSSPGNTLQHKRQENWFAVIIHKWVCAIIACHSFLKIRLNTSSKNLEIQSLVLFSGQDVELSMCFKTRNDPCGKQDLWNLQFTSQTQMTEVESSSMLEIFLDRLMPKQ